MSNKTSEVNILFNRRTAVSRGPTSSQSQNDMMDELAHDLIAIQGQINDSLVPVMSALPDGTDDILVNAFTSGIDGRTIYANSIATDIVDITYYNSTKTRPNTIYEQFTSIYTAVSGLQDTLEAQIDEFSKVAADVSIADVNNLYDAANVETALTEVMEKVNLLSFGQIDLMDITSHYVPSTNDTYDIGTTANRIRNEYLSGYLYLGTHADPPASAAEGELYYDTTVTGLRFYNGTDWKTIQTV